MPIKTANILRRALLKARRICGWTDVTVRRNDIRYRLNLNEYIDSQIYLNGHFEDDTTYALQKLAKPGMTIFDIGANSGAHTLRMAEVAGTAGKVIAFEPVPWAQKKLEMNIALNKFNNIVIEGIALSNQPAKSVEVEIAASWPTGTNNAPPPTQQLLHPIHKGRIIKEHIDFSTIDNYVRSHEIKHLDIIKIDTDGYELKVLRGGTEALKRFLPILIVEMDQRTLKEKGDTLEELTSVLEGLGYKFYSSESGFRRLDKESILSAKPGKTRSANVVCINKKEKLSA